MARSCLLKSLFLLYTYDKLCCSWTNLFSFDGDPLKLFCRERILFLQSKQSKEISLRLYYTPAQSAFLLRFVRIRVLFAALLLFICFACSQPINAATYSVTTTADSNMFEVQTFTNRIWGLNDFGQLGLGNTRSPQITCGLYDSRPQLLSRRLFWL